MKTSEDAKATTEDAWFISVKTVGGGFTKEEEDTNAEGANENHSPNTTTNSTGEKNFVVAVSPEDGVTSLHDKIEGATGLKASQQRLIYRGRLIGQNEGNNNNNKDDGGSGGGGASTENNNKNSSSNHKIKDITGLGDGQTIHLVKKRDTVTAANEDEEGNTNETTNSSSSSSNSRSSLLENEILGGPNGAGGGGGSLLAALLGLSSLSDENTTTNNTNTTNTTTNNSDETSRQRWGWRSSRLGRNSRRPHYRLSAEDLQVPDPGSMEPVRQGLMTLHTLLPHTTAAAAAGTTTAAGTARGGSEREESSSPLEANREWYRGQWIDCRDTVNQWLEATIVEVVSPSDVLPSYARSNTTATRLASDDSTAASSNQNNNNSNLPRRRAPHLANDSAVSASDLEGRRRLLLESCEAGDEAEEEDDLVGFRQRDNNEGVQLLLIHYNGWPHRWDEWIRSDSERIRPFRTRTRHPSMSSTSCPTPQAVFNEAPRTHIRDGDESEDRTALLPELSRAVSVVNDLLNQVVQGAAVPPACENEESDMEPAAADLPWMQQPRTASPNEEDSPLLPELEGGEPSASSNIAEPFDGGDADADHTVLFGPQPRPPPQPQYSRQELQNLATLFDRLGRTLTDAAPHIASMVASMPEEELEQETTNEMNDEDPHDLPNLEGGHHPPLGGLLSLWSRERRRQALAEEFRSEEGASAVDPDHMDYVSGLINTSRGEVRSGPRSRSPNDDVASLLGAYLAAASLGGMSGPDDNDNDNGNATGLGRLLRERGTGGGTGGGIDIHIHAVVTAPGVTPGALGLAALGGAGVVGGGTTTGGTLGTRNLFSSSRRAATSTSSILRPSRHTVSSAFGGDDEDTGLFSELYSETPSPVDPNGSPEPGERRAMLPPPSNDEDDFLARISDGEGLSSTRRRSRRFSTRPPSERRSSGWGRIFRRRRRPGGGGNHGP